MIFLVCQGAEYQALNRGLKTIPVSSSIISLPMGFNSVHQLFQHLPISLNPALLIGLAGSLCPEHQVGDVFVYKSCSYIDSENKLDTKFCDSDLSNNLAQQLNLPFVKGLTANRLVNSSELKLSLQKQSGCQVVDMETFAVMSYFPKLVVIRIISDRLDDHLPDLNSAIDFQGKLNNWKMTIAFLQQPLSAIKLISNSLSSLKKLEEIAGKFRNKDSNLWLLG